MQASIYRTTDTPQQVNHLSAVGSEGGVVPCSHAAIVGRLTPMRFASFSWLNPACALAVSSAFAILHENSSILLHLDS